MGNHRTPDGVTHRNAVPDSAARTSSTVALAPRATPLWTYGAAPANPAAIPSPRTATPPPFPRIADLPADVTAPARPTTTSHPLPPAPSTAVTARTAATAIVPPQAGPAPHSPVRPGTAPVPSAPAPAPDAPDPGAARRSAPDDIAARATTTLIPSSPGARRSRSGPVFVDGSGRRARAFKGVAAAAAALAAGYVGVVVTGALAGSTGPALPVAPGASLAPATPAITPTPVIAPAPVTVEPAEVTTKKTARATTPKRTTPRAAPKKVAPKLVAPAPVVPVPVAPVVPAPAAPVVPPAPAAPTPKEGTGQTGKTDQDTVPGNQGTVTAPTAAPKTITT